ncbi:MAG: HD domain-containing phosphohydrolase, partial [Candidatus Eremiobacterota bacterium]
GKTTPMSAGNQPVSQAPARLPDLVPGNQPQPGKTTPMSAGNQPVSQAPARLPDLVPGNQPQPGKTTPVSVAGNQLQAPGQPEFQAPVKTTPQPARTSAQPALNYQVSEVTRALLGTPLEQTPSEAPGQEAPEAQNNQTSPSRPLNGNAIAPAQAAQLASDLDGLLAVVRTLRVDGQAQNPVQRLTPPPDNPPARTEKVEPSASSRPSTEVARRRVNRPVEPVASATEGNGNSANRIVPDLPANGSAYDTPARKDTLTRLSQLTGSLPTPGAQPSTQANGKPAENPGQGFAGGQGSQSGMQGNANQDRRGGGDRSQGESKAAGAKPTPEAPVNQGSPVEAAAVQARRAAQDPTEAQLASLSKLNGVGVSNQALNELASRHAAHTVGTLLKKAYKTNELSSLDEDSAVNALGLVLKMGGEFTYAHSARVLDMSMALADELGINDFRTRKQIRYGALLKDIGQVGMQLSGASEEELDKMGDFLQGQLSSRSMRMAGLLHDIGKVRVPNEILYKNGKLTEEEFQEMKMHPVYGEEMIWPITSLRHLAPAIRGHHERWDGKGYPDGLKGTQIPLAARIIAVADVFDALISPRPYKPGMPLEKVRSILQEGSGTHFDPVLVEAFMRVLEQRYGKQAADA